MLRRLNFKSHGRRLPVLRKCVDFLRFNSPRGFTKSSILPHPPFDSKLALTLANFMKYSNDAGAVCKKEDYARDTYHEDIECAMNKQITAELSAFFTYYTISFYFGRSTVALPGCQGFYIKMYEEELQHALILSNYQSMRGGWVNIKPPEMACEQYCGICQALQSSLKMEKDIKKSLTEIVVIAGKHCDLVTVDFITTGLLKEQDESICELARLYTRAKKMSDKGAGEFLFDKVMHEAFVKKKDKIKMPENDFSLDVYK